MCGINGIISLKQFDIDSIHQMNDKIVHRGPDDEGLYLDENKSYSIGLGMRRLSIIDLSEGNQPMYSDDEDVVIVFNGEIYNYKALKSELESKNIKFKTNSDTEVILKMYLEYGKESFSLLDGMFAFSIYDKRINKVFITRDFFGEKPLYYKQDNNGLIWGSELKSIISHLTKKPNISQIGIELYFSLTYIPAPYSIYEDIFKLEPNKYIEYSLEKNEFLINEIHSPKTDNEQQFKGSFESAKKITRELIFKSVHSRSVSDVPIGSFLSGGVDSSIISLCLARETEQKINTFSIGFEKKSFDETDKSRVVAKLLNSNHHEFIVNEKNMFSKLDDILENFDEPFSDASALPTYMVSNKTSDFLKVALTGDGGDEVFGGYNKYYINEINRKVTNILPPKIFHSIRKMTNFLVNTKDDNRGLRFKIKKTLDSIDYNGEFYWNIISLGFKKQELNSLLKVYSNKTFQYYKEDLKLESPNTLQDLRNIDKHLSLEGDMLVKVDRTSMLTSLECRAPFLNKEIWDFTNSLPSNFLIHKRSKKHILKEAFKDDFPTNFLEKSKQGFGVPVGDWLRGSLKNELISYIDKKDILEQDIFNYDYINNLVYKHVNGIEDNTFKVWAFYCFQKWYNNNFMNA